MLCLLAFAVLLCATSVHSWDVAVTAGDKLEFYSNSNKTNGEGVQFRDLTALAYDAVSNMLLFVDKRNDNASIFSYNITTGKTKALVRKRLFENIQGLAYDPVEGLLFWTDSDERKIYWMSMKQGSNDSSLYGNLFLQLYNDIPKGIAVDSCRGYVYWTNTNMSKPTIERARFNGQDREIVVGQNLFNPVSIAIDQQSRRLYWADDKEGNAFTIESTDLDGQHREVLLSRHDHQPHYLTVANDSIYWVDLAYSSIWQLPKYLEEKPTNVAPKEITNFRNEMPFGIAAYYSIEDQTKGVPECKELKALSLNNTNVIDSFQIPTNVGVFCVHGTMVNGKTCVCAQGYIGERCEVNVCQNFCFHGDCSVANGEPKCLCEDMYQGDRCEINKCQNYCMNMGICETNEKKEPTCYCPTNYEGSRCETPVVITTTTEEPIAVPFGPCKCNDTQGESCEVNVCQNYCLNMGSCSVNENKEPVCHCPEDYEGSRCETRVVNRTSIAERTVVPSATCNCTGGNTTAANILPTDEFSQTTEVIETCDSGWDSIRDTTIVLLGVISGILSLVCVVLITKILQLRKRPRIKKRIIVNKNVTPMTARPDQCEITIENCCNMNICETPCFEPRSTIRPKLLEAKPGKEEKRNLISNMEYPDDPY